MSLWYHSLSWKILRGSFCVYLHFRYNTKAIKYNKPPQKPFVYMANHSHLTDPFLIGTHEKTPVCYIANRQAPTALAQTFSKLVRTIPKKKAVVDPQAIKETFRRVKNGNVIGLFPEGDRSWDGETDKLFPNTIQFVRKLKIPIRLIRLRGNYLSWPRWAETKRRGKIILEIKSLYMDEIKNMSNDELHKAITDFIYQNDIKDSELQKIQFTGKNLAHGIRFLLWLCPSCHSHDSIYGEENEIICSACKSRWEMDGNQRIKPHAEGLADIKDWTNWQKSKMKEAVANLNDKEEILLISNDVDFRNPDTESDEFNAYKHYATGDLKLSKEKVIFEPYDENKILEFPIENVQNYVDNFNRNFEFSFHSDRYQILFKGKNSSKWIFFLRLLQGID